MSGVDTVDRLMAALRARDPEAIAAELHPEVEARGAKGTFRGVEAVVRWAKPNDDGYLVSRVEIDEVRAVGHYVAVDARRLWRWKGGERVEDESRFGLLFELRDDLVYRWRQDFPSIVDAIESIPAS